MFSTYDVLLNMKINPCLATKNVMILINDIHYISNYFFSEKKNSPFDFFFFLYSLAYLTYLVTLPFCVVYIVCIGTCGVSREDLLSEDENEFHYPDVLNL